MRFTLDCTTQFNILNSLMHETEPVCKLQFFTILYLNLGMNPELDIGQVEGAYMMGLGLWLTEKIIYDSQTGKNLTNGTWVNDIVSSHFSTFYEKPFHVVQISVVRYERFSQSSTLSKSERSQNS